MKWIWVFLMLAGGIDSASFAGPVAENDSVDEVTEVAKPTVLMESAESKLKPRDLLSLGLRLDSSFSEGGPTDQGFSIPSIRLTAYGDISDYLNYRLSFGETREFSSAQLPQILPVEAYFDLNSAKRTEPEASRLNWRVGMFTPTFNPWWTPDLTDIEMPDYLDSHRALFLSRDLGTEVSYDFKPQNFKIGVGAFNGNGIVALNSNNSKAFTGFAREIIGLGDSTLEVGAAAYGLFQSTQGSINYKQDWAGDLYVDWNVASLGLNVMVDGFTGNFQDSISNFNPAGGSASASIGVFDWLKVFARWEMLSSDPSTSAGLSLHHFQIGPILKVEESLKIYSFYEYYDHGDGNIENSFQIRARLII